MGVAIRRPAALTVEIGAEGGDTPPHPKWACFLVKHFRKRANIRLLLGLGDRTADPVWLQSPWGMGSPGQRPTQAQLQAGKWVQSTLDSFQLGVAAVGPD